MVTTEVSADAKSQSRAAKWAWIAMWVLVFAYVALAGIFMLSGDYAPGLGSFALAVVALVGMLLARRGLVA